MNINTEKSKFKIFSSQEMDSKFAEILTLCKGLNDHIQIAEIIRKTLFNQLYLGYPVRAGETFHLYRATTEYENINILDPRSFSYPPDPSLGRANIKGHPVFYGSLNPHTALKEIKHSLQDDKALYLSEWIVNPQKDYFIHSILANSQLLSQKSQLARVAKNQLKKATVFLKGAPLQHKKDLEHYIVKMADLFTTKGSENYHITSAYAHDILYAAKTKGLNVSILMYPSIEADYHMPNYAIHPDFVNAGNMILNKVLKVKVKDITDSNIKIDVTERGFNKDGMICWQRPTWEIDEIDFEHCEIFTENKTKYTGDEGLRLPVLNTNLTVEEVLIDKIYKCAELALNQMPFEDDIFTFTEAKRYHTMGLKFNHGLQIQTLKGISCIRALQIPIKWTERYS